MGGVEVKSLRNYKEITYYQKKALEEEDLFGKRMQCVTPTDRTMDIKWIYKNTRTVKGWWEYVI